MIRAHIVGLTPVVLLVAMPIAAQERESPVQSLIDRTGKTLVSILSRPLHPFVGGVAPGGGAGAGLAYDAPLTGRWNASAKAGYTLKEYWRADLVVDYNDNRTQFIAYARTRDMKSLEYFGPGEASRLADRSNFRLRDPVVGAQGSLRVTPWLALGARAEQLWPDVSQGLSTSLPSIEQRFDDTDAPGLTAQPHFGRYDGSIDIDFSAGAGEALYQGGKFRATYALFVDQELERFSFHRIDLEAQQRFALLGPFRRLTLHGWVSTSTPKDGHEVPFYLQRTLGSHGRIASVNEYLIGSDGTQATLRGFRAYRFRDRHLVLLQAEYRIPIWGPIDATLFADAGKVTPRRSDLDLSGLRRDYGVSLSVMRGPATAVRVDVAFGGGEGTRLLLTFGRSLLQ
ncbi:MAG: hypothetical protein ACREOG_16115 [Gemmatimonadaceae bacterium]